MGMEEYKERNSVGNRLRWRAYSEMLNTRELFESEYRGGEDNKGGENNSGGDNDNK